jgi:hypothetical protein
MDKISGIILVRSIELLLGVALWKAYGAAEGAAELWAMFARASELHQVGTITCLVLIGRTAGAGLWHTVASTWRVVRGRWRLS